jgi:membrane protease YdiL (CAAX protease family)
MIAVTAAWLAFMTGVYLRGDVQDAASFAVAAAIGAGLVAAGFAAARRCRTLARGAPVDRIRLAALSVAIGAGLGFANLAANLGIAAADPRLRTLLEARFVSIGWVDAVVAAPLVEEVAVRLFLMSAMAWFVSRFTKRAGLGFAFALIGSALVFALLHLARPLPIDSTLANFYRAALLAKYTMAGIPLGWLFWRWGLPYAMVAHAMGNAVHLVLENRLF